MEKGVWASKVVREVMGMWEGDRGTGTRQRVAQVDPSVFEGPCITQKAEDGGRASSGTSGRPVPQFQAARR